MVHLKVTTVLSALLSLSLLNCGGDNGSRQAQSPTYTGAYEEPMTPAAGTTAPGEERAMPPAAPAEEPETMAMPARLSDQEIAAVADAANSAEVEQAKVALDKARDPRVRNFAQMMLDHHGQARRDQAELVNRLGFTPTESDRSRQLRADSAEMLSMLRSTTEEEFDKKYMKSQVKAHEKVLNALDSELIPQAQNAELRSMLQNLRQKIEAHLTQARALHQALESQREGGPGQPSGEMENLGSGDEGSLGGY